MLHSSTARDSTDRLTEAARFHDYRYASNPIADGTLGAIPGARFGAELHEQGITRTLPLDTSSILGCRGPATSPGLCANFIHICPGDAIITDANASSQLFFVMRGTGTPVPRKACMTLHSRSMACADGSSCALGAGLVRRTKLAPGEEIL